MYTPTQSVLTIGSGGDPLPTVWQSFANNNIRFMRGQLCLVCAGPGAGKSAMMLAYVLRAEIPTLYFSADSDAFTQLTRTIAILTDRNLDQASQVVKQGRIKEVAEVLDATKIRFVFDASPTLSTMENTLYAYYEVYGQYPWVIIVDNITNVATGDDDEQYSASLERLMDYLHVMARGTGACVVGMHHVTGSFNDLSEPVPLSGVKGQIARVPEMVLTIRKDADILGDKLVVAAVKNRFGRSYPTGRVGAELKFDGASMNLEDY